MNTPIYTKLMQLKNEKRVPFHMPGHKRRGNGVFKEIENLDITEITDYDNLHHPEGIIRESMDKLKQIYGTRESWYLVNGSTVGILAAISACCEQGDGILIARNCHKSVYNAIRLLHLEAHYFYPDLSKKYDLIENISERQMEDIRNTLAINKNIRAVVLPSPTYEGVVMDIARLKKITEEYDVILIVDEAHGAHFPFHEYFPESAIHCGGDIVIQSTHKTLPAMTQTALLHLCTDKITPEAISDMLSVYESSSPSYILMASAEYSAAFMKENVDEVQAYVDNLQNFREKCEQLHFIHLINKEDLCCQDYDRSKLVFSVKEAGWNGITLFEKLFHDYHIELEMADNFNCIAMTSVCDSREMYEQLFDALKEIDEEIAEQRAGIAERAAWDDKYTLQEREGLTSRRKFVEKRQDFQDSRRCKFMEEDQETRRWAAWEKDYKCRQSESEKKNQQSCHWDSVEKELESWQCRHLEKELLALDDAAGRIAGDYVMLYPPGIPLLVPGEKILKETVENLRYYIYNGYNVLGLSGDNMPVLK